MRRSLPSIDFEAPLADVPEREITDVDGNPIVTGDGYVHVWLGRLDWANGPADYPFPTVEAAQRFAEFHEARDPGRDVFVLGAS
jgi:hypothetical protein